MRGVSGRRFALVAGIAMGAGACGDERAADRAPGAAAISPTAPLVGVTAVQLASFSERGSAERLIDSLDADRLFRSLPADVNLLIRRPAAASPPSPARS